MKRLGSLELPVHGILSVFVGCRFPPPTNYHQWSGWGRFLWNVYSIGNDVLVSIHLVFQFYVIFNSGDLGMQVTFILSLMYISQMHVKQVIFSRNWKRFDRLFEELKSISLDLKCNPLGDNTYPTYHNKYYGNVVKIALIKIIGECASVVLIIALFIIASLFYGVPKSKVTPGMTWWPIDKGTNPVYSIVCIYELLVYTPISLKNAALDLLFLVMLLVPMIQLKYMKLLMKILMSEERGIAWTQEQELNFRWWKTIHQRILRVVMELEELASPFLTISYMTVLLNMTMAGLVALSTSSWTVSQQVIINALILANTLQLYFNSLAGDFLRTSAEEVTEEGLSVTLFTAPRSVRQDYLFILTRTQCLVGLTSSGVNPLSSNTFGTLIRNFMSYFITLVQLRSNINLPV